MDLRSFFETILIDYKDYKTESFSRSKFRPFITIEGKKIIADLLPNDYEVTGFCGRKKWAKSINIRINNRNYNSKFSIVYVFKEDNTGFTLFLSSNLKFDMDFKGYDHASNDKLVKECREKLSEFFDEELVDNYRDYLNVTRNDFNVKDTRSMIYAKSYSLPLVSQEELLEDLSNFIDFYAYLNGDVESKDDNLVLDFTEDLVLESESETNDENGLEDYEIYDSFYNYLLENDYYFDKETIENYLLSLKVKPFAILTGNSGTGKTKLSQLFAKYLSENYHEDFNELDSLNNSQDSNLDIVSDLEKYVKVNVKLTPIINRSFVGIPKMYLSRILHFDEHQGHYDGFIEGFPAKFSVVLIPHLKFNKEFVDNNLKQLYSGDSNQTIDIKIKSEDIINFIPNRSFNSKFYDFYYKVGNFLIDKIKVLSKDDVSEFFGTDYYPTPCEVIVNGISTTADFSLQANLNCLYSPYEDKYVELLSNKGSKDLMHIRLDLDSFEPTFNNNFRTIIETDELKEEYFEGKIPIGSIQVKNSIFKDVLPLEVYSGKCNYVIDGFPIKGRIYVYVKLKLKDKTTTGNIKIKRSDIKDLITDEGYLVDIFDTKVKVGASYYRRTWDLGMDNNIEDLIPIKTYSKECEIIVDDVPQKNTISIYPVVRFDKDEELSNHLKKLYREDSSQLIDLNIDLKNFERYANDNDLESSSSDVVPFKSSSSNILVEKLDDLPSDEEYMSFEMNRGSSVDKMLKKGEFGAPARKWGPLKDIINFNKLSKELVKFKIDDIEVDASLLINAYIWCGDELLTDYFKESVNKDTFSIKVKKEDIRNLIRSSDDVPMKTMEFKRKLGTKEVWACPPEFIDNFIPLKNKSYLNVFIDGKQTVVEFIIFKIEFILKEGSRGFTYFKEKSSKNPDDNIIFTVYSNPNSLENMFDEEYLDSMDSYEVLDSVVSKPFNILSNYKIVPVGANWTENRNIVGYYNLITEEYQSTPAYDLINQSKSNLDSPHFLILDEMNLSHVERYFADFLSAIESGESIPLYGIEEDLEIPNNLFIIGTVNVDETTYMFSPKVLDRANVFEFKTYSSKDYMLGNINLDAPNGNISYLENPLSDLDIKNLGINELKDAFSGVKVQDKEFWDLLSDEIFKFQSILKESGFDFGFRVINEIVRFMLVAWKYEGEPKNWTNWERYFDAQIKQKMLPKLHGSEKILGDTLTDLAKACESEERIKYYGSAKKLKEMMKVLDKQRYVSFIN